MTTLTPPAIDLSETIAALPDPRALDMVDNYAKLIAWMDHHTLPGYMHDIEVHAAMNAYIAQWPLAKPHLLLRYVRTYQHTRRILREA